MAQEEDLTKFVNAHIDNNPEEFEIKVLAAATFDFAFFKEVRTNLCTNSGKWSDDFDNPLHNALYNVISSYNGIYELQDSAFVPITEEALVAFLLDLTATGKGIADDEIPAAVDIFKGFKAGYQEAMTAMLSMGFSYWLSKKRSIQFLRTMSTTTWDPKIVADKLRDEVDKVYVNKSTSLSFRFGHGLFDKDEDQTPSLQCSIPSVNRALGGGFAKGDGSLMIAVRGGGKTIAACQLAGDFAWRNYKGALISTEEDHKKIQRRFISNYLKINYDLLVHKSLDMEVLKRANSHAEKHLDELLKTVGDNLNIVDWCEDRSLNVLDNLEAEVLKQIKHFDGKLDFIILDWIGGGNSSKVITDSFIKRQTMQATADKMAELAHKYKIVTIAMAQAAVQKGVSTAQIDETFIPECKTMGQKMINIVGISSFRNDVAKEGADIGEVYKKDQVFYFSKTRHSKTIFAKVQRQFEYQRFIDKPPL